MRLRTVFLLLFLFVLVIAVIEVDARRVYDRSITHYKDHSGTNYYDGYSRNNYRTDFVVVSRNYRPVYNPTIYRTSYGTVCYTDWSYYGGRLKCDRGKNSIDYYGDVYVHGYGYKSFSALKDDRIRKNSVEIGGRRYWR